MQICELQPEQWPGSTIVARFSVDISPDLKLVGLKLQKRADGQYRVRAPNLSGKAAFHVSPALASRITDAAVTAMNGGRAPHDNARS